MMDKPKLPVAFVIDKDGNAWNMFKFDGGFSLRCAGVDAVHRFSDKIGGGLVIGEEIERFPLGNSDIHATVGGEPVKVTTSPNSMLFLEMFASNWKEFTYWLSNRKIEINIVGNKNNPLTIGGLVLFLIDDKYPCNVYLNDFWIVFLGKYAVNPERLNEAR